mmetsp:Transcript_13869/g.24294  ORF Transcript_13869/g.24294 Transcript_13869/m.24294 type:complete len:323 (-) Transcript_13869:787-1755(-)|eukprot:CAMPEP_0119105426 /NCGR_PEP_ID=MMETSP1180-20130426/3390_1 /TAXON_ID=3052 ORGANISM="Chlamydomonas cf sp, Strain CCMP681" /NCGR_SAMPLE_ID=MMETSP1180 /ASSEMBLY_ACC=CAM_ASM_000741 /LENGTH=322 /DNA_ID=CAMNT_0007090469 /DNA_START=223 /DNA_END=1191 /DNA_ORIENTATION=+
MHTLASHSLVRRLWGGYERSLDHHPIPTQVATSAVLWATGDAISQRCTSGRHLDVRRTALTAVFGGLLIGPAGHFWYSHLDQLAAIFGPSGSTRHLLAKIVADSTLWNWFYMSAYFAWAEILIDKGPDPWARFEARMKEDFMPTYLAEIAAWPPIMAAIFMKLPTAHHLMAVNLVTVLDVAFIATVRSGTFSFNPARFGISPAQEPGEGAQQLHEEQAASQHSGTSALSMASCGLARASSNHLVPVSRTISTQRARGEAQHEASSRISIEQGVVQSISGEPEGRMQEVIEAWILGRLAGFEGGAQLVAGTAAVARITATRRR